METSKTTKVEGILWQLNTLVTDFSTTIAYDPSY